jgi:hypothetical protein
MSVPSGSALELDSRFFAAALLRESLASWTEIMLPFFKSTAQGRWGAVNWEGECTSVLSDDMKKQLKIGGWDAYRIATVFTKRLEIFLPNYQELLDITKELYRQVSDPLNISAQPELEYWHLSYQYVRVSTAM